MFTSDRKGVLSILASTLLIGLLMLPEMLYSGTNKSLKKSNSQGYSGRIEHSWDRNRNRLFYEEEFVHKKDNRIPADSYENYMPVKRSRKGADISQKKGYGKTNGKKISSNKSNNKSRIITYKVKGGDTLTGIAKKFNVPISAIISKNKLKSRNVIYKGMILKIPVRGKSSKISTKDEKTKIPKNKPNFQWPVKNVAHYKKDGSNGVKSIGIIITCRSGSSVYSSARGIVKKIGYIRGYGKYIVIKHSGRFATVYSNLGSIRVTEGQSISSGNIIGTISGNKKIHFQIDYAGKPENPLKYLPRKG